MDATVNACSQCQHTLTGSVLPNSGTTGKGKDEGTGGMSSPLLHCVHGVSFYYAPTTVCCSSGRS